MASLPEWGEWESAVRGWLRDPVVHRAGKPCHRRARQVQEMYGGRWAAGSRQNSAPTSCTWYCACVYRTIGGRGGPGAMRQ